MKSQTVMHTKQSVTSSTDGDGMDVGQKMMIGVVLLVVFVGGYFVFKPASTEEQTPVVNQQISPAAPKAVAAGGETYTLSGVSWVFAPQAADENGAPTTRARLRLDGFKRNGSPIDVALYRLGTYRGECMPQPVTDATMLALAQCAWNDAHRQLAAFQENGAVVVRVRSVDTSGAPREEFTPILSIDLAHIITTSL